MSGTRVMGIACVVVMVSGSGLALGQEEKQERPGYKSLRYWEDWSEFDASAGDDYWDPIKHVDLNEDGSWWASYGGEIRVRSESWQNFGFANTTAADDSFTLGRAIVHGDFHFGESLRVFVEGKSALSTDRDLPGGRRGSDVDSAAVQSAFVDWVVPGSNADGLKTTIRVGRQELQFGNQRLVSPLPWSNSRRTWDAARVILEIEEWQIDAFYSRFAAVQKYGFNDWQPGPNFFGVYATTKVGPAEARYDLDLYILGLDRKGVTFNGSTGTENRYSIGSRIAGKVGDSGFDFDTEGTYQFGEVGSADVNAYSFAGTGGYSWSEVAWQPRVYGGFDYASGDGTAGDGDVGTFNQLFPLGHKYLGYMDFVGRQNIIDASAGVSVKPHEKVSVKLDGHWFWRADTADAWYNAGGGVVRAAGTSTASEIGQEIDLTVKYKMDLHTTLQGGLSYFIAGDFAKATGPSADMSWVYLQLTYKF